MVDVIKYLVKHRFQNPMASTIYNRKGSHTELKRRQKSEGAVSTNQRKPRIAKDLAVTRT